MISIQRIWLFTVLFSPVIFWTLFAILTSQKLSAFASFLPVFIPSIIIGFLCSIPTMTLIYVVNEKLEKRNFSYLKSKILLSILLISGILITFFSIDKSFFNSLIGFLLPASYIFCSVSALWLLAEKKENISIDKDLYS
jgi:ABC-type polysaccharide transport system permease subunit